MLEASALRLRRRREESGRFLIEGFREIAAALRHGVSLETIFFCPELVRDEAERDLLGRLGLPEAETLAINRSVAEKLAYRQHPGALLAVARRPGPAEPNLVGGGGPALLGVLDGIEKPGNLGAALRTADAAGASGVLVTGEGTDVYNPNTIRASLGAVFAVPLMQCSARDGVAWCRRQGLRIVAATPAAGDAYTDVDLRPPTALVVGREDRGLDTAWLEGADREVRIPQQGTVDSLNAAVSFAVLLFEAVRQRSLGGGDTDTERPEGEL